MKEAAPALPTPVLSARDLCAERGAAVVDGISLDFAAGEFCLLRGEAGSGRTLLLRLLGLLDRAESGEVLVAGRATSLLPDEVRDELRNHTFGFIFSAPFLLPSMTVLENVAMPLFRISHLNTAEARERTDRLLDFVGLLEKAQEPIENLPPHAQHCVSLARALATDPVAIIAEDFAPGMQDEESQHFGGLLRAAALRFGCAVVAAVQPEFCSEKCDRIVDLAAGRVTLDTAALRELGA